MKIHDLEVTGSLIYNGVNLLSLTSSVTDSGSFSTQIVNLNQVSSSLNSFTSSINTTIKSKLDSESVISGSAQVLITGTTGYSTFSSSISSSIGSLSGSVATTTSGLGGRITTIEGNYATTGSNIFIGNQVITGSICSNGNIVTTGQIVAQTINVQQVTSSIVYSSGSNIFGNSLSNTQQFTGSVSVTGSLTVNGAGTFSSSMTSDDLILTAGTLFGAGNTGFSNRLSDTTLYLQMPATGFNITDNALNTRFILSSTGAATFQTTGNNGIINIGGSTYYSQLETNSTLGGLKIKSIWGGANSGIIQFINGTSENIRMHIADNGNVGIGTASPNELFEVKGTENQGIRLTSTATSGEGANLQWYSLQSGDNKITAEIESDGQSTGGNLFFKTRSTAGVLTDRVIIDNAGNVGIGTTSPASQAAGATTGILDVSAATGGNLVLHRTGSGDNALFSILKASNGTYIDSVGAATAANNAIYFRTNNINADQTSLTTALTIASTGAATFSNTETTLNFNPQTNLLASYYYLNFGGGSIMYRNNTDIYFGSNSKYNSAGSVAAIYTSANGMGLITMDGGNLRFQATDTSVTAGTVYGVPIRFAINGDGNVGIGTTTPSGLSSSKTLNVYGGAGIAGQLVLEGNSGGNFIDINAGTSSGDLPIILFNRGFRLGHATAKDATGYRTNYMVNCFGYSKMSPDGAFVNGNNTQYHSIDSINDVVLYAYNRAATGNGIISNVQSCNTSYYSYRGFSDPHGDMAFIYSNGTFGSRTGTYGGIVSDARCKTEICDASSQWNDIKNLRVRNFKLIEDVENDPINAMRQIGFIAQEVEMVSPGLVFESGNGCVDSGCWKNVKTSIIHTKAIKALQEAMCRIEILESCLGIM